MSTTQRDRRNALLDALDIDDGGTGNLGVVVDQALRDDPNVTADEIRAIWAQACEDALSERQYWQLRDMDTDERNRKLDKRDDQPVYGSRWRS